LWAACLPAVCSNGHISYILTIVSLHATSSTKTGGVCAGGGSNQVSYTRGGERMPRKENRPADQSMRHPAWNDFIAPGIASLERQTIPSISRKTDPDPQQFVITSILISIPKGSRVRAFNFIRRSCDALAEYRHARLAYYRFFKERLPNIYLDALHHFECCLACAYQGHELLFGMANRPFFDKDRPGRAELNYRMQRLYNSSKHTEGFIKASSFAGDTVAMWISNMGLETRKEKMSFDELAEIISDMSFTAWIMAKSHIWRGKQGLPKLRDAILDVFPEKRKRTQRPRPAKRE
jgi:hypothetical protein